jgi:hypothetical protein
VSSARAKIVAFCAAEDAHAARRSRRSPRCIYPLCFAISATQELRTACSRTDIDPERLAQPGAEVTLFSYLTFSENLSDVIGEDWPLQCLGVWGTPTQGALEVAARSAATIGDAVAILARFGHVRGPNLSLRFKRGKTATTLTLADVRRRRAHRARCSRPPF